MRWQFGGNFEPVITACEYNWTECPFALADYIWTEVVTDVVDCLANETILWRILAVLLICATIVHLIYWKIQSKKEIKTNKENLEQVYVKVKDLELKVNILTYKAQYGTWPFRQLAKKNSNINCRDIQLTLSNLNDKNSWVKYFLASAQKNRFEEGDRFAIGPFFNIQPQLSISGDSNVRVTDTTNVSTNFEAGSLQQTNSVDEKLYQKHNEKNQIENSLNDNLKECQLKRKKENHSLTINLPEEVKVNKKSNKNSVNKNYRSKNVVLDTKQNMENNLNTKLHSSDNSIEGETIAGSKFAEKYFELLSSPETIIFSSNPLPSKFDHENINSSINDLAVNYDILKQLKEKIENLQLVLHNCNSKDSWLSTIAANQNSSISNDYLNQDNLGQNKCNNSYDSNCLDNPSSDYNCETSINLESSINVNDVSKLVTACTGYDSMITNGQIPVEFTENINEEKYSTFEDSAEYSQSEKIEIIRKTNLSNNYVFEDPSECQEEINLSLRENNTITDDDYCTEIDDYKKEDNSLHNSTLSRNNDDSSPVREVILSEVSKESESDEKSVNSLLQNVLKFRRELLVQIESKQNKNEINIENIKEDYDSYDCSNSQSTDMHFQSKPLDMITEESSTSSCVDKASKTYILKTLEEDEISDEKEVDDSDKNQQESNESIYFNINYVSDANVSESRFTVIQQETSALHDENNQISRIVDVQHSSKFIVESKERQLTPPHVEDINLTEEINTEIISEISENYSLDSNKTVSESSQNSSHKQTEETSELVKNDFSDNAQKILDFPCTKKQTVSENLENDYYDQIVNSEVIENYSIDKSKRIVNDFIEKDENVCEVITNQNFDSLDLKTDIDSSSLLDNLTNSERSTCKSLKDTDTESEKELLVNSIHCFIESSNLLVSLHTENEKNDNCPVELHAERLNTFEKVAVIDDHYEIVNDDTQGKLSESKDINVCTSKINGSNTDVNLNLTQESKLIENQEIIYNEEGLDKLNSRENNKVLNLNLEKYELKYEKPICTGEDSSHIENINNFINESSVNNISSQKLNGNTLHDDIKGKNNVDKNLSESSRETSDNIFISNDEVFSKREDTLDKSVKVNSEIQDENLKVKKANESLLKIEDHVNKSIISDSEIRSEYIIYTKSSDESFARMEELVNRSIDIDSEIVSEIMVSKKANDETFSKTDGPMNKIVDVDSKIRSENQGTRERPTGEYTDITGNKANEHTFARNEEPFNKLNNDKSKIQSEEMMEEIINDEVHPKNEDYEIEDEVHLKIEDTFDEVTKVNSEIQNDKIIDKIDAGNFYDVNELIVPELQLNEELNSARSCEKTRNIGKNSLQSSNSPSGGTNELLTNPNTETNSPRKSKINLYHTFCKTPNNSKFSGGLETSEQNHPRALKNPSFNKNKKLLIKTISEVGSSRQLKSRSNLNLASVEKSNPSPSHKRSKSYIAPRDLPLSTQQTETNHSSESLTLSSKSSSKSRTPREFQNYEQNKKLGPKKGNSYESLVIFNKTSSKASIPKHLKETISENQFEIKRNSSYKLLPLASRSSSKSHITLSPRDISIDNRNHKADIKRKNSAESLSDRTLSKSCIPVLKNRLEPVKHTGHDYYSKSPVRGPLTMTVGNQKIDSRTGYKSERGKDSINKEIQTYPSISNQDAGVNVNLMSVKDLVTGIEES